MFFLYDTINKIFCLFRAYGRTFGVENIEILHVKCDRGVRKEINNSSRQTRTRETLEWALNDAFCAARDVSCFQQDILSNELQWILLRKKYTRFFLIADRADYLQAQFLNLYRYNSRTG